MNKVFYVIEYSDCYWDEKYDRELDDYVYGKFISPDKHYEIFDNEIDFNSKKRKLNQDDGIEITSCYYTYDLIPIME